MAEEVKEDVLEIEKETVDNSETVEDAPKTFTQSEVDELSKKSHSINECKKNLMKPKSYVR